MARYLPTFPQDIWNIIFPMVPVRELVCLCTVSSSWRSSIYEAVTSLDGMENAALADEHLERFSALRCLVLIRSKFVTDNSLRTLSSLTDLNLGSCLGYGIRTITDHGVSGLTNLNTLSLAKNNFVGNHGVSRLTNLTSLDLSDSYVVSDDAILGLTKLRTLYLKDIEGCEQPSIFSCITQNAISSLVSLTYLDLTNNRSVRSDCLSCLTNLSTLVLNRNIWFVGANFETLPNLRTLELERCSCVASRQISSLTKLTALNLAQNNLIYSADVSGLIGLTYINLAGNRCIKRAALTHLTNLTTIDLLPRRSDLYPLVQQPSRLGEEYIVDADFA